HVASCMGGACSGFRWRGWTGLRCSSGGGGTAWTGRSILRTSLRAVRGCPLLWLMITVTTTNPNRQTTAPTLTSQRDLDRCLFEISAIPDCSAFSCDVMGIHVTAVRGTGGHTVVILSDSQTVAAVC